MLEIRCYFRILPVSNGFYLGPLVRVADLPGRRALRSAGSNRLVVPPVKLFTVGSRAFPVAAAQLWNNLPDDIFWLIRCRPSGAN